MAQKIHPNFRIKSSKLGMSLTVHCSIPAAYALFVKYKRAVQTHPIVMKFDITTPLYVHYKP